MYRYNILQLIALDKRGIKKILKLLGWLKCVVLSSYVLYTKLKCLVKLEQCYLHNKLDILSVGGWVVRRCHVSFVTRGVQLILADSWARPAILVAGKGREVMFLFLLFLHFHSCFSFFPVPPFHLFCYLFCLFSPFLWETTQNDPQGLTCR